MPICATVAKSKGKGNYKGLTQENFVLTYLFFHAFSYFFLFLLIILLYYYNNMYFVLIFSALFCTLCMCYALQPFSSHCNSSAKNSQTLFLFSWMSINSFNCNQTEKSRYFLSAKSKICHLLHKMPKAHHLGLK